MTKSRERKTRNIIQVKYIKDVIEQLLTKDKDIKNRWQKYFDKLFNEDSESSSIELNISSDNLNRQFMRKIQEYDVKDALKRINDGRHIEVWRSLLRRTDSLTH
jgi:dihydroorotate dehydrogenase